MKRITYISTFVLALSACTAEPISNDNGRTVTIEAYLAEDNHTKTIIKNNTGVYWEPGDEVKLFFDGVGSKLSSTISEPASVSSFSGTFNGVIGFNEGFSDSKPLWGLYPYRADATADNSSVTTTLPSSQTGRAGSFAKGTFITLAKSQSLKMGFYNVCGGVRFSLENNNISEIVFEGMNEENLAGNVKLTFDGDYPAVSKVENGEKSITLTAPDGGCFETGKWYYIVTLPVTLSNGFKMTFNTAQEYAIRSSSSSVTIKRGVFGSLEDVDQGLIFIQKGSDPEGDNIVFKDPAAKFACVVKYDTNGDGEVSIAEAEAATSFSGLFIDWKGVTSFDEIIYFKNVHSISGLFDGCSKLVSITIPENITDLGTYAFRGCSSLTSVVLPSNITAIGNYTFQNCSKLQTIDIPAKVTAINQYAFSGCSSLIQVAIPYGVTSLGTYAFSGCSSLTTANIPSGITAIPNYCFQNCSSLASVSIPDGVTSVGNNAFSGVEMWSLQLPASVKTLGAGCFGSIVCVVVPSTAAVSIQSGTFSGVQAIFVPTNLIEMYKAMTNWTNYSYNLHPLNCYKDREDFFSSSVLGISGAVDMGTSVKWAACNLGASKPEEHGGYYQWAGLEDVTSTSIYLDWDNCPYHTGSSSFTGWTKYIPLNASSYWSGEGLPDNKTILDLEDDVAHVKWGESWRMPTYEEYDELIESCYWEWTTYNEVNGQMVYSFETDNKIFLPAAGYRSNGLVVLYDVGSCGYYWSSSLYTGIPYDACGLILNPVRKYGGYRFSGLSVRPVSE